MTGFLRIQIVKVLVFLVLLGAGSILLYRGEFGYAVVCLLLILVLLYRNFQYQKQIYRELEEFSEAVRYQDFSRHYPLKNKQPELLILRSAFNEVNATFRKVSQEREVQHLSLHRILELVDTAILSYDETNGRVVWMNPFFKDLFAIQHLTNIHLLKTKKNGLYRSILDISPGKPQLITLETSRGGLGIQISASRFQTQEGDFRLIAFQNINEAMDETESKAWQKLLSVLTHEIMNSIAPISSLAGTMNQRLNKLPDSEDIEDIRVGTATIQRRSEGLLKFAESYRSLNKIERPDIRMESIASMFENLYQLMEPTLIQKGIEMDIILKDPKIKIALDRNLIEQALINLVLNAIEAVKNSDSPKIELIARLEQGRPQIKVKDNGPGMSPEVLESIFVPFFTTRKNGSGIGLTLSKQIMHLHKGSVQVSSAEGAGSVFSLLF